MSEFSKARINPVNYLKKVHGIECPYVTFDEHVKPQYSIVRGATHEGAVKTTQEIIDSLLKNLVEQTSYYNDNPPEDWEKVIGIRYTVGFIRLATVSGEFEHPEDKTRKFQGMRQRARIPVRCEFIYEGDKAATDA